MMRIQIGKEENAWVDLVSTWVSDNVEANSRIFMPAGNTPAPVYRRWSKNVTPHLKSLSMIQIDDILNGPMKGNFKDFFIKEMNPYLSRFEWIEQADRKADYAILGVGLNGHVAFHEPGISNAFYGGCVRLSTETLNYIGLDDPTWGVTYGAATFLQCKKILVLARGEHKKKIMQKAATDRSIPIGWIMAHHSVTLISDFDF